jgi:hypothetical protein
MILLLLPARLIWFFLIIINVVVWTNLRVPRLINLMDSEINDHVSL